MTLRTEGQIILAANMAQDLTNLVVGYLEFYKKHAQGLNDVRIPEEKYSVLFRRNTKEGFLNVKLVYTKTTTWETPDYYDVDSDYFDESWSASNVSGYTTHCEDHPAEYDISIPISHLLKSKEDMEKGIKEFADRKKRQAAEERLKAEIAQREAELAKLKEKL